MLELLIAVLLPVMSSAMFIYGQNANDSSFLTTYGVTRSPTWDDKTVDLYCESYRNPEMTYVWMAGNKSISDTSFSYRESHSCEQDPVKHHLQRCRSNITITDLRKEDSGVVIKCIYLFKGAKYSVTNVFTIDLPFPATQVAVTGNVSATVNSSGESQIILQCSSNAGNPAPVLMWYKGSGIGKYIGSSALSANEIPDLYNGVRVTHTTVLKVNSTMDGCLITCCADFSNVCQSVRLDISSTQKKPIISELDTTYFAPYIAIETSPPTQEEPQSFYIQYKATKSSVWFEISQPLSSDALFGQELMRYVFDSSNLGLQSGEYQVRIKTLSQNGLVTYTGPRLLQIKKSYNGIDEDMETKLQSAIVLSFLATAVVFTAIGIPVVILAKRGAL